MIGRQEFILTTKDLKTNKQKAVNQLSQQQQYGSISNYIVINRKKQYHVLLILPTVFHWIISISKGQQGSEHSWTLSQIFTPNKNNLLIVGSFLFNPLTILTCFILINKSEMNNIQNLISLKSNQFFVYFCQSSFPYQLKRFLTELDALFNKFTVKSPIMSCQSGNRIVRFCISETCQADPRCCHNEKCKFCLGKHQDCFLFADAKKLTKKVEQKCLSGKKIVQSILKSENDLINELISSRKFLLEKLNLWKQEDSCSQAIKQVFFQVNVQKLSKKTIKDLLQELQDKSYKSALLKHLENFKLNGQKTIQSMINDRNNVIDQLLTGQKHKSKILREDPKGKEKMAYLLKEINNPIDLKLLFRASEHNFEAEKFWQRCSNIPNTLTIIKNNFNKTIAAFTPLKLEKGLYKTNLCVADKTRGTFLLQLDLQEKMNLLERHEDFAICQNKGYGPAFGKNGYDLWIGDKCNLDSSNSGSKFPNDFNCGSKYKQNQESRLTFCGVQDGFRFSVVEYEVFQVIR